MLPQEKMYYYWEDPEIDKLNAISVYILVKRDPTLLPELDAKAESGKELEEEDDYLQRYLNFINLWILIFYGIFVVFLN